MNIIEKTQAATPGMPPGVSEMSGDEKYNFIKMPFRSDDVGEANITTLVSNVIDIILYIAGVLAVVYLIYSGILYITAAGNPDAAKKGQQGIINAVIGIVVIVLAFFIARAVANYANTAGGTTG